MKWETVTSTIGHSAFALWNNGKKLMTLVFNPASNAARVESGAEKEYSLFAKKVSFAAVPYSEANTGFAWGVPVPKTTSNL